MTVNSIIDEIEQMTVTELVRFTNTLYKRLGMKIEPAIEQAWAAEQNIVPGEVQFKEDGTSLVHA